MKNLLRFSAVAALALSMTLPMASVAKGKPGGGSGGGPGACQQVITFAAPEEGAECQAFPTPCDVPEGWVVCDYPTV